MKRKLAQYVMTLAIMTGCSVAAAGAGAFATNLITSDPSRIAKGAVFAAVVPFAFGATCLLATIIPED